MPQPRNGSTILCYGSAGMIATKSIRPCSQHFMRCAPRDEAIYIGACFPPLLHGLYYEGWHAAGHVTAKGRRAFLERIQDGVHRRPGIDAEQVTKAVLALLSVRLPPAELENAKAATPEEIRAAQQTLKCR